MKNVSEALTPQQMKEIILLAYEKGQTNEDLDVKEIISFLKEQITMMIQSSERKQELGHEKMF